MKRRIYMDMDVESSTPSPPPKMARFDYGTPPPRDDYDDMISTPIVTFTNRSNTPLISPNPFSPIALEPLTKYNLDEPPMLPILNDNSYKKFLKKSPTDVFSFFPPPTPSKLQRCESLSTSHRFQSDFDVIATIGIGSFGKVYQAMSKLDGCMYAIKATHRKAKSESSKARMLKEVYALAALMEHNDPAIFHIVRYHQAWMEESRLFIQTELCTSTLAQEIGQMTTERKYKLLREVLLALEFLHRNKMVHFDIKPENIFVKEGKYKLGDFGLASKSTIKDVEEGDSRYMPYELLSGDLSDLTKCDIFSLGATLYETCTKPLPSSGPQWHDIRNFVLEKFTPHDLFLIIQEMLDKNPNNRPSAKELLSRRPLLSTQEKELILAHNKVALLEQKHNCCPLKKNILFRSKSLM